MMHKHILTIDVEEWYHAELIRKTDRSDSVTTARETISEIIELLALNNAKATFFVVGELLKKDPGIGKIILRNNHELAYHGWSHVPLWRQTRSIFTDEAKQFISLAKQIGCEVRGFRAPTASLDRSTFWIFEELRKLDFTYDSSVFPAKTTLYGVPNAPVSPYWPSRQRLDKGIEKEESIGIQEFPFLALGPPYLRLPLGTGFFFRVIPHWFLDFALQKRRKERVPAVISFHTWEFSSDIPIIETTISNKLYLYTNLAKCKARLIALLAKFRFTSIDNYISQSGAVT
ncbi:MAG: polysaccharide deacetylase family protein [Candidatus Thorarchaeota archaeon]